MKFIDKRTIYSVVLISLLIVLSVMPMTGCGSDSGTAISKDQAIEILVSNIMKPAAEYTAISAYMLSQPLKSGDVVTSESGQTYRIDKDTWFVFIDDDPAAFFAHDCRYILIDANTGSHEVIDETWPPEINNHSMWDTQGMGRGNIINFYPVLGNASPTVGDDGEAPVGDYGDAPDGQYDSWGRLGRYPTLFNTTNSHFGRPGGHTLHVGEEILGMNVSAEVDANDPVDPDGVPNLVDSDSDERIYIAVDGTRAQLVFSVTVASNAPNITRYINALIDFDQSGNWSHGTCGTEWVVVNQEMALAPGSSETIVTPWFSWGNKDELPSPVWMRLLLDREQVDEALFASVGGWDGSGQFEYGEIEDYLAYLTDKPEITPTPTPSRTPSPSGGGGSGVQKPGPATDPCGDNINYYVITISGGDFARDIASSTPAVEESADTMARLASDQGYTSMGDLGPGSNSIADIGQAFDNLAQHVKCSDHILIYICGHGMKEGGITLRDSRGKTQEVMKPDDLAGLLSKIPHCEKPDDYCDEPAKCCHVTVIIESCYAGNFNVPGVTGNGRTVVGTSTDTPAWGTGWGGGIYTQGFDKASRSQTFDANGDKAVDPAEAGQAASNAVNASVKNQKAWREGLECECKCRMSMDAEKWVWDDVSNSWVNETTAMAGQKVRFRLEIGNDGERELTHPVMTDFLPSYLEYAGGTTMFLNASKLGTREPDDITNQGTTGHELVWDLTEIGSLAQGGRIAIEFDAVAKVAGTCVNELLATAHSAADYSLVVSDQADATVMVISPQQTPTTYIPNPEEVLYAYLYINIECTYLNQECVSCAITADFYGQDLTVSEYPVTNVVLKANGQVLHDSGAVSTTLYEKSFSLSAGCGQTYNFELIVTNYIGLEGVVTKTIAAEATE